MLSLQSYGNAALKLHENGYIPIPIKPLTKKPSIRDWSNLKNAELKPDGYIYNVIFSALHFIKENKTLEDAIKFSGKANYCSIIFGVIKRCLMRN